MTQSIDGGCALAVTTRKPMSHLVFQPCMPAIPNEGLRILECLVRLCRMERHIHRMQRYRSFVNVAHIIPFMSWASAVLEIDENSIHGRWVVSVIARLRSPKSQSQPWLTDPLKVAIEAQSHLMPSDRHHVPVPLRVS